MPEFLPAAPLQPAQQGGVGGAHEAGGAHGGGIGTWPGAGVADLAYIGLFAGPIGTWCVMQVSATLPAMVASVGFLATPAAGLLLSTLWLHEALTPDLIIGSAFILGGVAFAAWPSRR